jgi:hypothetical protein
LLPPHPAAAIDAIRMVASTRRFMICSWSNVT